MIWFQREHIGPNRAAGCAGPSVGVWSGSLRPSAGACPASTWLLVHTKPKQERVAERALTTRGLSVYCPRVLEPRAHIRAPRGPMPLFPSYVLCNATPEDGLAASTYCPGVHRLVRFGDAFAVLGDADVAVLRARESKEGYLVIPRSPIRNGNLVRITRGPLSGLDAVVDGLVPSKERVRLLLSLAFGVWKAVVPLSEVMVVNG
jgi:transcriptional antiterminator RfaH